MKQRRPPFRRFHQKLFLLMLALALLPLLAVGLVNILVTSNLFTRQLEESADLILSRTAAPLGQLYQEFKTAEGLFLQDEELMQAFANPQAPILRQVEVANRLSQYLSNIKYINADFRVSFLLPRNHYLSSYGLPVKNDPARIESFSLDKRTLEHVYWLSDDKTTGEFTWIVPLGSVAAQQLHGCLLITIPYSSMSAMLEEPQHLGQSQYLIVDAGNERLIRSSGTEENSELQSRILRLPEEKSLYKPEYSFTEGDSYYSIRTIGAEWMLLGIVPRHQVLLPLYKVYQWTIGLVGLLLLGMTLLSIRLARNFSRPIERLALLVVRKKSEGTNLHIPPLVRADEIGVLYDGIRELLMEIGQEQVLKKEYRLRLLQYQINPHFLYNSLDTIQWKALEHKDRELTNMIEYLSGFLRGGLDQIDVVTVEQELRHLNNYIGMQQIRYKGQFTIAIQIPEEFMQQEIVKISLQPLVENAIMYGMSRQAGGSLIKVEGWRAAEDAFCIGVFDDGQVLDEERVQRLLSEQVPDPDSFGIRNVHERIRLYFGEANGLRMKKLEQGKCFELLLPYVEKLP